MVTTITHKGELITLMEKLIRNVMEESSEEILEIFKKEYIEKFAYAKGKPVMYPTTFEFRDSWIWGDIKKHADTLVMEMFNDWERMPSLSRRATPPFIHTTFTSSDTIWDDDSRPHLASILDNSPISTAFLTGNRVGGYWTKFIRAMFTSGKLKRIIDKNAKAKGITPSIGVSI